MDELYPLEPVQPPSPRRRRLLVVLTLLVLVAFVVVAGLEGSGFIVRSDPGPTVQTPSSPPAPARFAYVDLDGALNVVDAGRSTVTRLPANGATYQFPAWSPDANHVAAIRSDERGTSLEVFDFSTPGGVGGAAPRPTTVYASADEPVFYLYWSPDSHALAFLTTEPDGIALRHAPADASTPATIVRKGAPMYWQWVDPSTLLVHSGGDAPGAFAGAVTLDGSPDASTSVGSGTYRTPALSGDGRYVAFSTDRADGSSAVIVQSRDGTGGGGVPVFSTAAFEFDPAGDTLAFTALDAPGGTPDVPVGPLRLFDPASGAVRTLVAGNVVGFFWSPDGRTIAALSVPGPGDTKVASSSGGPVTLARAVLAASRADLTSSRAAAGVTLRLAFVDVTDGSVRSMDEIFPSDLFINQVLPYFDQYALSHRFWSPDGRSITLPVDDGQAAPRITSYFADGSDAVQLVDGAFASWSP